DGDLENEAREPGIGHHEVRAPADDLHAQAACPRGGERLAQLRLGPAFEEVAGRAAQPKGGVGCEGHAFAQGNCHDSSYNMNPARTYSAVRSGLRAAAIEMVLERRWCQANHSPPPAAPCQRSDDSPATQTRPPSASPNAPTSPAERRATATRSSAFA